ncbi:MAG TPA: FAD-dependent oxidoreductase [Polyangiaceae bacterium]|nr:FAD-dependent oxidoreductase [Polyangiaceae bacterium]
MGKELRRLVVVGSGFAGVWAALSAAQRRKQLKLDSRISITVVSPERFLGIRPRYYEADLSRARVDLPSLFQPVGVQQIEARARSVDRKRRILDLSSGSLEYDALVWAAGSETTRPTFEGAGLMHDVDSLPRALAMEHHLQEQAASAATAAAASVVIVGAGFTGIELAAEMTARLARLFPGRAHRVVLVDQAPTVAGDFGPRARAVIVSALQELGIELRVSSSIARVSHDAVQLDSGETIAARTVVWAGGVRVRECPGLPESSDSRARIRVDQTLRAQHEEAIWFAGDVACADVGDGNLSMMSCQHAMPQGRFAGYNALSWLAGKKQQKYQQGSYRTCLDLGPWGALVTRGFERDQVVFVGAQAKAIKRFINNELIYPPLDGEAASLLKAARLPRAGLTLDLAGSFVLASRLMRSWIRDPIRRVNQGSV